ncbi:MAG: hypothetical protein IMW91_00170 [Firmicutes bacterium]|nr:hypothetical protein [Bacillota bacterium]
MIDPLTMQANAVGNTPSAAQSPLTLDPSTFLKLFITELQYQDPTQPVDAATMMQQFSQLATLQATQQWIQAAQAQQTAASEQAALALLGKQVTLDNGESGPVASVSFAQGYPQVSVNGGLYSIAQVVSAALP